MLNPCCGILHYTYIVLLNSWCVILHCTYIVESMLCNFLLYIDGWIYAVEFSTVHIFLNPCCVILQGTYIHGRVVNLKFCHCLTPHDGWGSPLPRTRSVTRHVLCCCRGCTRPGYTAASPPHWFLAPHSLQTQKVHFSGNIKIKFLLLVHVATCTFGSNLIICPDFVTVCVRVHFVSYRILDVGYYQLLKWKPLKHDNW